LWDAKEPRVADIGKIERVIRRIPKGTIVRLGGMTDCFQPLECESRVALETIKLLNAHKVGYLIVTKSSLIADKDYMAVLDKNLAHIQITVTCLDDNRSKDYEVASPPSERIQAIYDLQATGFDVALRISPFIEEYIDFPLLNSLQVKKCLVEFLRVNSYVKGWFPSVDYSKYTLRHSNYWHLPLAEKQRLLKKVTLPNITICEDVSEHYEYWKRHYNPNVLDCCNLRRPHFVAGAAARDGGDVREAA
jgi:DNA repair photolyase